MKRFEHKVVFVSNNQKAKELMALNNILSAGFIYKDKQYVPEAGNSNGGVIFILEKDNLNEVF